MLDTAYASALYPTGRGESGVDLVRVVGRGGSIDEGVFGTNCGAFTADADDTAGGCCICC